MLSFFCYHWVTSRQDRKAIVMWRKFIQSTHVGMMMLYHLSHPTQWKYIYSKVPYCASKAITKWLKVQNYLHLLPKHKIRISKCSQDKCEYLGLIKSCSLSYFTYAKHRKSIRSSYYTYLIKLFMRVVKFTSISITTTVHFWFSKLEMTAPLENLIQTK